MGSDCSTAVGGAAPIGVAMISHEVRLPGFLACLGSTEIRKHFEMRSKAFCVRNEIC